MQTLCLRKKLKLNFILFHKNLTQVVEIYNHINQAVVKMNLLSEEELEEVLFDSFLMTYDCSKIGALGGSSMPQVSGYFKRDHKFHILNES